MNAVGIRNVSDYSTRVGIDNHHMRTPRDVNAPSFAIDSQIIPAALAANFVSFIDVITGRTGEHGSRDREQNKQRDRKKYAH